MRCPYCKSDDRIKVIDTRKYETVILRIRFCENCHAVFKTEEVICLESPVTIVIR